jgi:hypothetical protein
MSRKPPELPERSSTQPTDAADSGSIKAVPLRPPLKPRPPKDSPGRSPSTVKIPERIAGVVPGIFGPFLDRMMYRSLLGSPYASDYDLRFMLADPAVAKKAVRFITSLHKPNGRPGRPRSKDVTEAVRMMSEGKTYPEVYASLGRRTKAEKLALRDAMRKRRHRAKQGDKSRSRIVQADEPL